MRAPTCLSITSGLFRIGHPPLVGDNQTLRESRAGAIVIKDFPVVFVAKSGHHRRDNITTMLDETSVAALVAAQPISKMSFFAPSLHDEIRLVGSEHTDQAENL
jgi:hypothetical protein